MKFHAVLLFLLALGTFPGARAEDWTTLDGKSYRGVKVVKVEADAVTILDADGGALIPLVDLPPALRSRFHYDAAQAQLAAQTRTRNDAASARALQAEARQRLEAKAAKKTAPAVSTNMATAKTGPSDASHHDRDSLLQDGLSPGTLDPAYPARNDDGKNTSGQSHPLQAP